MRDLKHILFLPRWYPHRLDPMFGLFVRQHARIAAKLFKVSAVFVLFTDNLKLQETKRDFPNLTEFYFYIPKSKFPPLNFFNWINAHFKGINLAIKEYGPIQLSHVHILTRLGLIALFLYRFFHIPFVISEHWSRYQHQDSYKGFLRKWLTRRVAAASKAITTPSLNLQSAMQKHGIHGNYRILSNHVNAQLFHPEPQPNKPFFEIIHISCFEEKSKNMSGILYAMAELKKRRKDFRLTMVGTGMDFDATLALAEKLQLLDIVSFPGLLENEALASRLRSSDLLIMFSHYENLPVVISEALCCGIPVVSSDVGGISEILSPDMGILCPPNNLTAFVDAIERVMKNPESFDASKMAAKASAIWHDDAVSLQLYDLYQYAKS